MKIAADEVIARVQRLPALPRVVHDLERAVADENSTTARIVAIVSSDAALTVHALKLANSSFYGVSGRVVSLRDAVQILGVQTLSAAVMTAAVMKAFDRAACPGFDVEGCWRHALATALCAQLLGQSRGIDACTAHTVGLLHDIGTLALATHFPQPFGATLALSSAEAVLPMEAERALLGIDHAAVGGLIARHWRLAPTVIEAIERHHDVPDDRSTPLLDVLHLADNVAHALDLSHSADDMVPRLSLATWGRLAPTGPELQRLFEQVETRLASLDLGLAL
jgi:putative nucleotidyltransferase with HDIG domain